MNNNEFIPVTQEKAVQTNIEYSVKVGKQVMKAQLKKAIAATIDEVTAARLAYAKAKETFEELFKVHVDNEVKLCIRNDRELTCFRGLFTKFSRFHEEDDSDGFGKFKTNLDMFESHEGEAVVNLLTKTFTLKAGCVPDYYLQVKQEFLSGNPIWVTVNLAIEDKVAPEYDSDYSDDLPKLGYATHIAFTQNVIDTFILAQEAFKTKITCGTKLSELTSKLDGIDQVTEEMEAKLLVNQLNKSEEGKAALGIASELVSEMLGDTPALLDLNKSK